MTKWLAGMRMTADRMNDNTLTETTTTGAVAGTGFTLTNFSGRKVNGITTITVQCTRTGGNIAELASNTGDIGSEVLLVTLPAGWRPPETMNVDWNTNANDGGATLTTNGQINLQTTSGNTGIQTNHAPRVSVSWISENG